MKSDKPFLERYFYDPTLLQKGLIFALYPFSLIYQCIATIKRKTAKKRDFKIPLISIGNLIAGGSGKTPFILEIAPRYQEVAVVSRGYQRDSKGLVVVSVKGNILVPQKTAGDEAYLLALNLKQASVIVSEKRELGVLKALELGAKIVFLDDGFRFNFNQFNALLKPKVPPYYPFCLPSGLYRESIKSYKEAHLIITEDKDYQRITSISHPTKRMLLVTAIANPSRLDAFLPKEVVKKLYFRDHAPFDLELLEKEFYQNNATSLLVTSKDLVKLQDCNLPLSVLDLKLEIDPKILKRIDRYILSYPCNTKERL
ncbi:tetraacyldisaccharide 4'-kinase [Helicobacter pylori]|uniref:Tetraacyldisaccharide 4'-kinase n=1 Tax=Helicobacter pylori TaxID=210 RepID=A0AAD1DCJ1_HELPX|nr:tetraacyldisaccharide 4'-kinase [Helicobacter pylori]AVV96685.1 tetraacyldisaccharide 4'-kinase [Helicobacter pylori]BBI23349.1 tetraacyldisaccharide 4'-kinase [Helicobacter pylori]SQJ10339.1 tetraacyldisaccharide 4'-kinase [Helicobacter pylori NCTC 11637 = CCUG 17874 = ATCC 43504 = JCM 12093]